MVNGLIPLIIILSYLAGWWYTYPSEKYDFVSWNMLEWFFPVGMMKFPTEWKNKKNIKNVPNHQPDIQSVVIVHPAVNEKGNPEICCMGRLSSSRKHQQDITIIPPFISIYGPTIKSVQTSSSDQSISNHRSKKNRDSLTEKKCWAILRDSQYSPSFLWGRTVVGGWAYPLWKIWVRQLGWFFPTEWKVIKFIKIPWFQTTNQLFTQNHIKHDQLKLSPDLRRRTAVSVRLCEHNMVKRETNKHPSIQHDSTGWWCNNHLEKY